MHRGGSGRDLAGFLPAAAAAAATGTDEQRRRSTEIALPTYAAAYPYDYSDPTAHVYADYSDYGQYSGADYAQHGAVLEADQIPYHEDPQFPPYASDQHIAPPPQPHDLHHRGTVCASVESARWASSGTDLPHHSGDADLSDPTHRAPQTQAHAANNTRSTPSHQRRRSSGLVVAETAGGGDDPSSASVRPFFTPPTQASVLTRISSVAGRSDNCRNQAIRVQNIRHALRSGAIPGCDLVGVSGRVRTARRAIHTR